MQRKRPRDREDRFHYRFLERYDFIETSNIFLLSTCIILFLGMQARKGINAEERVLAGMITALASAFGVEARKKRCVTRLPPGIKPLRVSDLSDDEYFYRRFRFRKEHLVHFMMLINLYDHDKQEYQKIALDSERHYCYADTAMLIFLARMASPCSLVTVMKEFGMTENRLSIAFNKIGSYLYHEWALPLSKIEIWENYFPLFARPSALCGRPPQPRWRRAAPGGRTVFCRRRVAVARDEHAACRPRSAYALPSRAGGGPRRAAALCAAAACALRAHRVPSALFLGLPWARGVLVTRKRDAPAAAHSAAARRGPPPARLGRAYAERGRHAACSSRATATRRRQNTVRPPGAALRQRGWGGRPQSADGGELFPT